MEGGDSPYAIANASANANANTKVAIVWVNLSQTLLDRCKIQGPLASLQFLNLYTTASIPLTYKLVPS